MIKSENARPNLWVYVDIRDRDLAGFVKEARAKVERELPLPAGYALAWSGQFEYFERAAKRLLWVLQSNHHRWSSDQMCRYTR